MLLGWFRSDFRWVYTFVVLNKRKFMLKKVIRGSVFNFKCHRHAPHTPETQMSLVVVALPSLQLRGL